MTARSTSLIRLSRSTTLGISQLRPLRTCGSGTSATTRAVSQPGWPRSASSAIAVNSDWLLGVVTLVVRFQHSYPISAGTLTNVGIKGPLANIDSSGALDLTFALRVRGLLRSERQIRSTGQTKPAQPLPIAPVLLRFDCDQ